MSDFQCPCCWGYGYYCPRCNNTAPLPLHFYKEDIMSEFKVGDTVWWFCNAFNDVHNVPGIINIIHLKDIMIGSAEVNVVGTNDLILHDGGYNFSVNQDRCYKSKQDCIDAFKKRLDEL